MIRDYLLVGALAVAAALLTAGALHYVGLRAELAKARKAEQAAIAANGQLRLDLALRDAAVRQQNSAIASLQAATRTAQTLGAQALQIARQGSRERRADIDRLAAQIANPAAARLTCIDADREVFGR